MRFFAALLTATLLALPAAAQDASVTELIERARKRDAAAEYTLAMMAYEGRGVPRDPSQALRLAERGAPDIPIDAEGAAASYARAAAKGRPARRAATRRSRFDSSGSVTK